MKRLIPAFFVSSNFAVYSPMSLSPQLTLSFWVLEADGLGFF